MKRGEIYYVSRPSTGGVIRATGRPAVVVSCDRLAATSPAIEVVFLTTQTKRPMPTHAHLTATGTPSTALCEQVSTVSIESIGDRIAACSPQELAAIDDAIMHSLGLTAYLDFAPARMRSDVTVAPVEVKDPEADALRAENAALKAKLEQSERFAELLLDKIGGAR